MSPNPGSNKRHSTTISDLPMSNGISAIHNYPPEETEDRDALIYKIDDEPPWYLTIALGFQHYLTMAGSTVSVPFILCPAMCMLDDDPDRANIISTIMFVSGVVTVLQTTLGTRLPVVQGGSFSFLVPALAILSQPRWKCPSAEEMEGLSDEERTEVWQLRMREVQGAIIVASLFEVFLGFFGVIGAVLKYITPMTVAPAIAMIGLSLFHVAANHASTNWGIALLTIGFIILFSQYMRLLDVPIPFVKADKGNGWLRYPLFQVFPVLLAMGIAWTLCAILTATDQLDVSNAARTDTRLRLITQTPWFRFPYPFQWGVPTITAGAVLGMVSGVITGCIESVGDYYAAARISGATRPPTHAINRGIFIEGVGCVLAGIWGTGNGSTSYSDNIGAISVTKVGSRRVIQTAGLLMIVCALIGKVGAVFISIPEPIIGGVFCVVFATVAAVGLSNLQGVDLNSSRNIFIIGFSIFFGLTISQWTDSHKGHIDLGNETLNQIVIILLSTGMFVSGFIGFVLDNTIPGTLKERGIAPEDIEDGPGLRNDSYDLPYIMGIVKRQKWLTWVPISPTHESLSFSKLSLPLKRRKNKLSVAESQQTVTTIGATSISSHL